MLTDVSLRRTSLRDQVLRAIRNGLVTGQIVPGVVYSAAALAAELGVSNSPVREAMLALVDEGLMEVVPNRGYRPVTLSAADTAEIIQLRELLEVPAVGLAAERDISGVYATLENLVGVIEETAAAGDVAGNLDADREFHLILAGAGGNQRLAGLVARLRDQARLYNVRHLAESGGLRASAAEHRPLLAAVAGGDRSLAERLMRAHLAHLTTDWAEPNEGGRE
ncbi:MAG TPA: GntR family transcriptional regulator [Streptosporangiaceae bacterium]|nr:GntR family transcriptional regulator [Streptosporangiaceae bacterium]